MLEMDASTKGWIHNTAHANFWRVASYIDFDDLIQDGYMHYYRIANRYSGVKDRAHIMSLFKRTYINHFHDLSKHRTRQPDCLFDDLYNPENKNAPKIEDFGSYELSHGPLNAELKSDPFLGKLLEIVETPKGIQTLKAKYRIKGTHRETTNERLCRLCGADPTKVNIHNKLISLLREKALV